MTKHDAHGTGSGGGLEHETSVRSVVDAWMSNCGVSSVDPLVYEAMVSAAHDCLEMGQSLVGSNETVTVHVESPQKNLINWTLGYLCGLEDSNPPLESA